MAAITITELVETADTTGGTSSASGAYTPTANTPCIAIVIAMATVAATPTFVGNGLTWTRRISQLWGSGDVNMIHAFDSPGAASPSNGAGTFDCTGDASTGTIIHVVEIGNAHASAPFVQRVSKKNPSPGTGTTPNVDFTATVAANGIYVAAACLANPAGMSITQDAFTEMMDTGFSTPTTGGIAAADPQPGVTTNVVWDQGGTKTQWGSIGYELAPLAWAGRRLPALGVG